MSNFLAVATVTAALAQVVRDAVSRDVTGAEVTTVRPSAGASATTPRTGVNVFLYSVAPSAVWRNADVPTRRGADGVLTQRPVAALELNYLLSFYGDDRDLEPQRLLGSTVATLHAAPTLPRAKLREVIAANPFLAPSDLAEAVEAVRFTPVPLPLDEMSKVWSVLFQTPYALSVAYQGAVVFVETSAEAAPPALPVRARNVYAVPLNRPFVERVAPEDGAAANTPITAASTLILTGRNLLGETVAATRVRLGTTEVAPATAEADQVTLPLGSVPATQLRAGVQGVQIVHDRLLGTPPTPHWGEESNVAAFVLRPTINKRTANPADLEHAVTFTAGAGDTPPRLSVALAPLVGRRQRAALLLNDLGAADGAAFRFTAENRAADTNTLVFDVPGLPTGRTYLVRVQVDGAESPVFPDAATGVYTRPQVVIP